MPRLPRSTVTSRLHAFRANARAGHHRNRRSLGRGTQIRAIPPSLDEGLKPDELNASNDA
jgi:hypothetical protein